MINFRFHLVSLTAVFLALALGIAMGATVVDRATVNLLENRLDDVERNVDATNRENDQLRAQLDRWRRFGDQAGDVLVQGRLAEARILIVAVKGIDRGPLERVRESLGKAGATIEATLWLTNKLTLTDNGDLAALRRILGVESARADAARRAAILRLADAWATPGAPSPLPALKDAAFVEVEAPGPEPVDLATVGGAGTRFLVVSGPDADVPNGDLAAPLAGELATRMASRVLAAEAGRDARGNTPAQRALFVGALREGDVAGRLSTVDDIEEFVGRTAAVLALEALGRGRTGHFGVGPGASRLLPEQQEG